MVNKMLDGLVKLVVGAAMLGTLVYPQKSDAESQKIYDHNFGSTNVVAEFDKGKNTLELKVLPKGYEIGKQKFRNAKLISHPNIYVVHQKDITFEIKEEGFLPAPYSGWQDLKEKGGLTTFFKEIVNASLDLIPFNVFNMDDLMKLADRHDQKCQDFARSIVSESGQGDLYKEITKYSEGINMTAIRYKISFGKGNKGKVSILGGIDSPKACFSFNFGLGEDTGNKNKKIVPNTAMEKPKRDFQVCAYTSDKISAIFYKRNGAIINGESRYETNWQEYSNSPNSCDGNQITLKDPNSFVEVMALKIHPRYRCYTNPGRITLNSPKRIELYGCSSR